MSQQLSSTISKVFGITVLRNDGSRIYSKYYTKEGDLTDFTNQKTFEKNIFEKSRKLVNIKAMKPSDTEIFGYGRYTILFKILQDVQIYIIADPDENEGLLASALKCIVDSMGTFSKINKEQFKKQLYREQLNNKIIIDNFQGVILIIDEVIDQGYIIIFDTKKLRIIINIDSSVINARYQMLDCDAVQKETPTSQGSAPAQQTFTQQAQSKVGFLKSFFNR